MCWTLQIHTLHTHTHTHGILLTEQIFSEAMHWWHWCVSELVFIVSSVPKPNELSSAYIGSYLLKAKYTSFFMCMWGSMYSARDANFVTWIVHRYCIRTIHFFCMRMLHVLHSCCFTVENKTKEMEQQQQQQQQHFPHWQVLVWEGYEIVSTLV